jgi:tight adherence protein C
MIEGIWTFMTETFGPFGPILLLGFMGLFAIVVTLPVFLARRADPFDKIQGSGVRGNRPKSKAELRLSGEANSNLDRFAAYLEPQNQKEFSQRRLKLVQAGYRTRSAVRTYHFAQFVLAMVGLAGGAVFTFLISPEPDFVLAAAKTVGPAFVGYYFPSYWVERRRQTRQEELLQGFPDSLDLMLVCIEAGQSLDQTIQRVARETAHSYPTLSEELTIVSNEIRAGKDRATVLRDFAERSNVSDIKAFVSVLVQSAIFGTTIGEALRVYAAEMRDKRVMRAEEKANTLPTKMTLATMMFTVPPLLVILVGPSLYDIYVYLFNNGN